MRQVVGPLCTDVVLRTDMSEMLREGSCPTRSDGIRITLRNAIAENRLNTERKHPGHQSRETSETILRPCNDLGIVSRNWYDISGSKPADRTGQRARDQARHRVRSRPDRPRRNQARSATAAQAGA